MIIYQSDSNILLDNKPNSMLYLKNNEQPILIQLCNISEKLVDDISKDTKKHIHYHPILSIHLFCCDADAVVKLCLMHW